MKYVSAAIVIFIIFSAGIVGHAVEISDLDEIDHKEQIENLLNLKIIEGYHDGTFRPYETVTRGQYIAFLARALNLPDGESNFKDVAKGQALYKDVSRAHKAGIVLGDLNGYVHVNQPVTREEAAVMTDRALNYILKFDISSDIVFSDQAEIGTFAATSIKRLSALNIIDHYENNRFAPKESVNRLDAAILISRLVDFTERHKAVATDGIPVLLYHHLLKDDENFNKNNRMIVSPTQFEEQMKLLHEHGYQTVSLHDLYRYVKGEIPLPEKSVVITFDDGLKSNYHYAYPILEKYGFNATIFLITKWMRQETSEWNPYLGHHQYLSWEEVKNGSNVFEYGSHTHMLHTMDRNRKSFLVTRSEEEIKDDLRQSIDLLDKEFLTFAYPFGQYNEETKSILKQLGFQMAFSTKHGKVYPHDDLYELKRLYVYPDTSMEQFKRLVGIDE